MQWSPTHSSGFYTALGIGLVALLLVARWFATTPAARSPFLFVLRAVILAVLVAILLDPVEVTETRLPPKAPRVAYLVDCSRSMALERPLSRLERARQMIQQAESQIGPGERPNIDVFGFGEDLFAKSHAWKLNATGNESRLRSALEDLPGRLGEEQAKGVVVFSDGRATETGGYAQVAAGYKRLGLPVHVVALGNPRSVGDVAIQDLIVPREARSGMRVPVRVVVRSRGYEGERAELRVRSLLDPGGAPLASLPITLNDGENEHELVIESDKAKGPLIVEVPPVNAEAVLENNRVPFQIAARHAKIRVIYMEGTGANEYHWIRDALVEEPNIECVAMEVDAQYNQRQRLHRIDNPALGYPTTREELFTYDVVICSDIHRAAFSQQQLDWTVELVGQRGGGFAMIGGNTSFGSGQWDQTAWDGIIPIDMSGAGTHGDNTLWNVTIKVEVPPEVENHPIWRIVDDPVKNREILKRMPPFYGSNLTDRLKPAATALGVAEVALPFRPVMPQQIRSKSTPAPQYRTKVVPQQGQTSQTARQLPNGKSLMPVMSAESYGKGRTFALSSDSTVDWGRDFEKLWGEGDNRYFRKFWRNVVQWLAENSANANRRLRIETDKVLYHPGEPIQITARAFDAKLEPSQQYRLTASLQGLASPQPAASSDSPSQPARRSATLTPRAATGDYAGELTVPSLDQLSAPSSQAGATVRKVGLRVVVHDGETVVTQSDLDVQIMDDSPEYRDPRPDSALLEQIATGSNGRVLQNANDLANLLRSYHAGQSEVVVSKSPAWDKPALWMLLVGLLTTEWIVRRLKGLF